MLTKCMDCGILKIKKLEDTINDKKAIWLCGCGGYCYPVKIRIPK